MPKIKGIEFTFADQTYIVPPLSLGDLELLQERIATLQVGATDPKSISTVIDTTFAALKRNYPEMTRETVAAMVDLENMGEVLECVMDISGAKRKEGEAAKKAESAANSAS